MRFVSAPQVRSRYLLGDAHAVEVMMDWAPWRVQPGRFDGFGPRLRSGAAPFRVQPSSEARRALEMSARSLMKARPAFSSNRMACISALTSARLPPGRMARWMSDNVATGGTPRVQVMSLPAFLVAVTGVGSCWRCVDVLEPITRMVSAKRISCRWWPPRPECLLQPDRLRWGQVSRRAQ